VEAGYTGTPAAIRVTACNLLTNPNIWALIEKRREEAKKDRIIDIQRRQEILSGIAENTCEPAAENKDVIKSIDTLNKMDGVYVQKHEVGLTKEALNAVLNGLPKDLREAVIAELTAALSK
jgi:phage terminase small subunit